MSENKKKVREDTSGKAALERGQEAIAAQEKLAEKEKSPEKAKADKEDAEKWRNEG